MTLSAKDDVRDFRVLLKGQLPTLPHLSYTFGYMYDKARRHGASGRPGSWSMYRNVRRPLRRADQGRLLDQQDHGRLPGLDQRARDDERRADPDSGRRFQVERHDPERQVRLQHRLLRDPLSESGVVQQERQPGGRARGLAAAARYRQAAAAPGHRGALRRGQRRPTAVPVEAGVVPGAVLRYRYRQVRSATR